MKNAESLSATNDELLTITNEEHNEDIMAISLGKERKGSKILLGDKTSCDVLGMGIMKIKMQDGVVKRLSDWWSEGDGERDGGGGEGGGGGVVSIVVVVVLVVEVVVVVTMVVEVMNVVVEAMNVVVEVVELDVKVEVVSFFKMNYGILGIKKIH
ncbi:unnamed protein product [Prunus armeniaca]